MKVSKTLLSIVVLVFILAACSSTSGTSNGVKDMQAALSNLQINVEANDGTKAKEDAEKIEESWAKFEDDIKKNQPDMYEKVEGPLGMIQAGSKESTLDQETLKDQINKLNEVLKQIK